ncbi:MAG: hypothetical protein JSS87_04785 [Acidobacteria bacterium]|nr:hypothetical protein [Acidobacteriota bacterium]
MNYRISITLLALTIGVPVLCAQNAMETYARSVFFDNSSSAKSNFYSRVKSVSPSSIDGIAGHLPLEKTNFVSAPNSLRLHWISKPNGAWTVELQPSSWPNRGNTFSGTHLSFWIYAAEAMGRSSLPQITLRDGNGGFTLPLKLEGFSPALTPKKWTRISIPLSHFVSASVKKFDPARTNVILFSQSAEDGVSHTLYIDEIRFTTPSPADLHVPQVPQHVQAKSYERHVDLTWDEPAGTNVTEYVIYRAEYGGSFHPVGVQRPGVRRFADFVGKADADLRYRITARTIALRESVFSNTVNAHTHTMSDDELLDMVEEASFHYYWDGAEPHSGMAHESIPGGPDTIAVGGSGFGIMSMIVAAERGFAPREAIVERMLRITNFLAHADRFHGAWPHFLSGTTGHMLPVFGVLDDGADLVETSFLMQGLLAARGYFTRDNAPERELRDHITKLWEGVEWNWFLTPSKDALWWHWSPHYGFAIANRLHGYNETMITYVLAIASPTHGVPASLYRTGWESQGDAQRRFPIANTYYGIHVDVNYTPQSPGPLFFTHYNFLGFDPHFRDSFTDWFKNSRNISLVQQRYSMENPLHMKGYSAESWGLSAVTGPRGYREFQPFTEDDGTLAPTAAVGAYAYTPKESLAALKHFYRDLGAYTWSIYGFRNAFNEQTDWYSPDELALNQGPQAIMIENGRTGLLWRSFMANPEITRMEKAAGLKPYGLYAVEPAEKEKP